jgi:hypothetical protein
VSDPFDRSGYNVTQEKKVWRPFFVSSVSSPGQKWREAASKSKLLALEKKLNF